MLRYKPHVLILQDAARLALRLDRSELGGRAIFVSPCKKGVEGGSQDQPKSQPQVTAT